MRDIREHKNRRGDIKMVETLCFLYGVLLGYNIYWIARAIFYGTKDFEYNMSKKRK